MEREWHRWMIGFSIGDTYILSIYPFICGYAWWIGNLFLARISKRKRRMHFSRRMQCTRKEADNRGNQTLFFAKQGRVFLIRKIKRTGMSFFIFSWKEICCTGLHWVGSMRQRFMEKGRYLAWNRVEECKMKSKAVIYSELIIMSINYIMIQYALSNMAMLLKSNPLFILFFASEVWTMGIYWQKSYELTQRKMLSAGLLILCFAIQVGLLYFVGRTVGEMVPFWQ